MLRTNIGFCALISYALLVGTSSPAASDAEPTPYDRLHDAIQRGDLQEAEWIARRFPAAVIESPDQSRSMRRNLTPSALARAVNTDDQTMVKLLLKYGAEVNPGRGAPPLHLVKSAGIAQILIDAGASVRAGNKSDDGFSTGTTPLHCAQNVDIAKTLLAAGAELNYRNSEGETPLSTAIQRGNRDVVEYIFQKGGKVAPSDVDALTSACQQGELETARRLLDQGVKIGHGEDFGLATLHAACRSGNPKVVELLLVRGENPSAGNRDNPSPAFSAAKMPLDLEMEHHDHAGVLNVLKDHGAKLDLTDEEGNTLLHLAAQAGNAETTKYLLSCGIDVHARNKQGHTPLHLAAMAEGESYGLNGNPKHHAAVAELLLLNGADPRSKARISKEVLVFATNGQSFETATVTEVFTPASFAARRYKWSDTEGEIDVCRSERTSQLAMMFLQGATAETNARIARDVENGNRAREAVGEVLQRFGAE